MKVGPNHYEVLGLDASASTEAVEAAVDRLARRADALAYLSPARSRELWHQVRQIREDLLLDPSRRALYDRSVMEGQVQAAEMRHVTSAVRSDAAPFVPDPSHESQTEGAFFWSVLFGATAAALVLLFGAWFLYRQPPARPGPSLTLPVQTVGVHHGSAYVSGQTVQLRWAAVPHATQYRLQVATQPIDLGDEGVFQNPALTRTVNGTSYRLKVIGAQFYYWRVQAYVRGSWTAFTPTHHFLVARPSADRPIALALKGSLWVEQRKRICWSAVPGAVGYRLQVSRVGTLTEHSTCVWLSLSPGRYTWRVAALVHGVRTYTGPYSQPTVFTIPPLVQPVSRPAAHKRKSGAVLVAALLPARRTPTSTGLRGPRPAVARASARPAARSVRAAQAGGAPARLRALPRRAASTVRRPAVYRPVPQRPASHRPAPARPAPVRRPPGVTAPAPTPVRPAPQPALPAGPVAAAAGAPAPAVSGKQPAGVVSGSNVAAGSSGNRPAKYSQPTAAAPVYVDHNPPTPPAAAPPPQPQPTATAPPVSSSPSGPVPQGRPAKASRGAGRP